MSRAIAGSDLLGLMPATAYVVANDAPNTIKEAALAAKAHYGALVGLCDGVDDQVEIQAAINAVPVAGGKVLLLGGKYNIAAAINMRDNLHLEGMGRGRAAAAATDVGATVIAGSLADWMIKATNLYAFGIRNLKIYGDKAVGAGGALEINNCNDWELDNIVVNGARAGMWIHAGGIGWINNVHVRDITLQGVYIQQSDIHAHGLEVLGCGLQAIYMGTCANIQLTNCRASWAQKGYDCYWAADGGGWEIQFTNCIADSNNEEGFRLVRQHHSIISDCIAHNNGLGGGGATVRVGISIVACHDVIIANNRCYDTQGVKTQAYGIYEDSASQYNTYEGNDCRGNATKEIELLGTLTNARNNLGASALVEKEVRYMKNTSGGDLAAGDVVILKAVAAGNEITTTVTEGDQRVFGMVAESIADTASGYVQVLGKTTVLKVDGTIDIAIDDLIGCFTTAKIGMKAASGKMAFAIALEAYATNDSNGVIDALLIVPRQAV